MKRKATVGGAIQYLNIPRNWLHQGLTYMDVGERRVRVAIELVVITALCAAFAIMREPGPREFAIGIASCAVAVHTMNWIFNGNFVALIQFAFPRMRNQGESATREYLNAMAGRLRRHRSIGGVLVYGSIARGAWHDRSDMDLRILRTPGVSNLLAAVAVTMQERIRALISWQPIDLYLADDVDFLARMRADEVPVFLIKQDERLDRMFPVHSPVKLQSLCR